MCAGNVGGAVVPDQIRNLDRTGSQTLLVLLIKAFERDSDKVGRRRQEFKGRACGPRFMKGMARPGCPNFIDFYRRGACFVLNIYDEPDLYGLSGRVVLVST